MYYLNFLFALQMLNIETILAFLMCCRVYGNKVAELPLVGTRFAHRRQGMCHLLMNNLEKVRLKSVIDHCSACSGHCFLPDQITELEHN
jgi:hypothetical protein